MSPSLMLNAEAATQSRRAEPAPRERAAPASARPGFPRTRLRRNRSDAWTRRLVAENELSTSQLVWPLFVIEGDNRSEEIGSMPGVERLTVDRLLRAVESAAELGVPAVALFPVVPLERKTADGREAWREDNLVCRAVQAVKRAVPEIAVICDVALDPYTSHGHDGILEDGRILNDASVEVLVRQALAQAAAGCDINAPSDMMDGRIAAMRDALDAAGFQDTKLCSYAAKYASCFYGPFRDAIATGGLLKGDKRSYQMDPANSDEALREVALDVAEGADMLIVKPGLPYLDIVHRVKQAFALPTFAYQVSGEYAMMKAAAQNGWLNWDAAVLESLLAFRRAGADAVFTYAALEVAQVLKDRR